jgi:hypothetical protein
MQANNFVLQQLQGENERLRKEAEQSKHAVKASEAINSLTKFVDQTPEPFDSKNYREPNPFTRKDGCF